MSEILSQEQIDGLLGQKDALGLGAEPAETPSAAGKKDYGALGKAIDLFDEQAGAVVSTIFNKTVTFEKTSCEKTDAVKTAQSIEPPMVLVTVPFRTGLSGALHYVLSKKDIARVSDLMMMGDGTAAYTEDHKDAIVELFGQIMGAYSTALGGKTGGQVSVDAISAVEFDFASPPFPLEGSDCAIVKGSSNDAPLCSVLILVTDDLGRQLMHAMSAADRGAEEAPNGRFPGPEDITSPGSASGDSFVETALSGDSIRTSASHENIDMLLDVELDVYIELGRTNLSIKRILELSPGSIVELDRMAGEPVDLLVNDKVVAKGEVVVVDENFGIRIVSLVSAEDRIKSLK